MRGEHFEQFQMMPEQRGSSPHARGAPPTGSLTGFTTGIIPACAGSTKEGKI